MSEVNGCWEEFGLWLEIQGLHDREAPIEDDVWIGHPDEWEGGDVPEPPPNFVGEYWEVMVAGSRCICDKCGQPHNPKLIPGGLGQAKNGNLLED